MYHICWYIGLALLSFFFFYHWLTIGSAGNHWEKDSWSASVFRMRMSLSRCGGMQSEMRKISLSPATNTNTLSYRLFDFLSYSSHSHLSVEHSPKRPQYTSEDVRQSLWKQLNTVNRVLKKLESFLCHPHAGRGRRMIQRGREKRVEMRDKGVGSGYSLFSD